MVVLTVQTEEAEELNELVEGTIEAEKDRWQIALNAQELDRDAEVHWITDVKRRKRKR